MGKEIDYPQESYGFGRVCISSDHYWNMLVDGKCHACDKVWGLHKEEKKAESIVINKQK